MKNIIHPSYMILIGLGSNLPFCGLSPHDVLGAAVRAMAQVFDVERVSAFMDSPAWPDPADPPFVNAVVAARADGSPQAVLGELLAIERAFSRRRGAPNAPRTLDLDLLDVEGLRLDAADGAGGGLVLPHPRIRERRFVLAPLAEVAPDWRLQGDGRTARELLAALPF